jgi:hypothetical protein
MAAFSACLIGRAGPQLSPNEEPCMATVEAMRHVEWPSSGCVRPFVARIDKKNRFREVVPTSGCESC